MDDKQELLDQLRDARQRIAELEPVEVQLGDYEEEYGKLDKKYAALEQRLAESEAGAAAMRQALESCPRLAWDMQMKHFGGGTAIGNSIQEKINAALSGTAGRDLLERVRELEVALRNLLEDDAPAKSGWSGVGKWRFVKEIPMEKIYAACAALDPGTTPPPVV